MGFKLVSGQKQFKHLTNKLDEKQYAAVKANHWMNMLNDGEKPTRWLKATSNGTKVNFDFIKEQEQYDLGIFQLEEYLNAVNQKYGLDFKLVK